jgi:hypothetical protein
LQLSENTFLLALLHIYTCHRQTGLVGPLLFGGCHPYTNCTVYGPGRNIGASRRG